MKKPSGRRRHGPQLLMPFSPHLSMCLSRLQTLLAKLLHMLSGLLQLQRPLLPSLFQRAAVFFHPLQQVSQSQRQHPQVVDGHSGSLWRCGGTTWWGRTGCPLLQESHQEYWQLQDTSAAHFEEYLEVQRPTSSLGFTVRAELLQQSTKKWIHVSPRGALVVCWEEGLVGDARCEHWGYSLTGRGGA